MDIGSLLIVLALVILTAGFIAGPFLEKRSMSVSDFECQASELQMEKDQILMNLQELELDHAMGKMPGDEYENQRSILVSRGAAVLREIDRLEGATLAVSDQSGGRINRDAQDLEAQIEMEIQQRRRPAKENPAGFCSQCGHPLQVGDRFCARCGSPVDVTEGKV